MPTKDKQPIIEWAERRNKEGDSSRAAEVVGANNADVEDLGVILDMNIVVDEEQASKSIRF